MDKIEILSVELLDRHRLPVEELKAVARQLQLEFGWHYLLDLAWILSHLGDVKGKLIMDAGAGTGVLQWYLAARGGTVLSVDRASRADLPWRFRRWTEVRGLRPIDLNSPLTALLNAGRKGGSLKLRLGAMKQMVSGCFPVSPPAPLPRRQGSEPYPFDKLSESSACQPKKVPQPLSYKEREGFSLALRKKSRDQGGVVIYNQDLSQLSDIPDNTFDAIAALSALEHNPPDRLSLVVQELLRVLKPGGFLLATLGASADQDWFHEPSKGWCYSEATLRRAFDLAPTAPSNYDRYDELMQALRDCAELRENLASFYFRSGDNGMPWGKWDPQYQSVGVLKVKTDQ